MKRLLVTEDPRGRRYADFPKFVNHRYDFSHKLRKNAGTTPYNSSTAFHLTDLKKSRQVVQAPSNGRFSFSPALWAPISAIILEIVAAPWSPTAATEPRLGSIQPGSSIAMARRFSAPYQKEPISSLASLARNLAVFSAIAVVVSIIIVRFGFLEVKPALATFLGALALAGLSILFGFAAFVAIWNNGSRGMGRILLAFLIDAAILAYPAYLGLQYRRLPPIHDITTDPIDPPRFEALAPLRSGDGTNTAVYAGLYSAEQQRLAYPNIETLELEVPVQRAYDVTLHLVNRRKWLVIDERPPQPPRRVGRIEAVARTPIMGFREDISIRVSPDGDDSRIDIRSASRYFESDLGSNAARITKLIDDINEAVDNAPTPKQPAAKAAAKAGKK